MASPRWITAAEVTQDEAGDVQGPASATSGNLAVFSGTTGKIIEDGGPVPGGGGLSFKVIDLGLVTVADVLENGVVELLPAQEGRLIKYVYVTPDDLVFNAYPSNEYKVGSSAVLVATALAALSDSEVVDSKNASGWLSYAGDSAPLEAGPLFAILADNQLGEAPGTWAATTNYALDQRVIDGNNHVQVRVVNGISGGSEPSWDDQGSTTDDGAVSAAWQDLGPKDVAGQVHLWVEVIETELDLPYPVSLEWIQQPTDAVAGSPFDPVIQVLLKDQNGDPYIIQPEIYIQLDILSGGTAGISDKTAFIDPVTAVASFDACYIEDPGTYTLIARYGEFAPHMQITSNSFVVAAP